MAYSTDATLLYAFPYAPPDQGQGTAYAMDPPLGALGLSLVFRNVTVVSDPGQTLTLLMQNLLPTNPGNQTDSMHVYSRAPISQNVVIDPTSANSFDIAFVDSTGFAFSDVTVPSALDLTKFGTPTLSLQVRDPGNPNRVLWQLSARLETGPTRVSLPASWLLLGVGLAFIVPARRSRSRRAH